jgi:RHS repeat-associated protein
MSTPSGIKTRTPVFSRTVQEGNRTSFSTLVKENATKSNAIQIPEISLPKGGGALKGIDEKFQVNTSNGTAGFSIPLPVTPGRNGFSPSLSLSYNSGAGNSPYGLGWSVDYPIIQRKTDKRLPRYREGAEEDIFMFSGAEDLVPLLEEQSDGTWTALEVELGEYRVKSYRPRVEGGFARIEKISHPGHGVYWKVTTKENVAIIFGRSSRTRIADPEDASRISHWLPEFSYDDKGNWIEYAYKEENLDNVPGDLHEHNRRNRTALLTNKYLKQIRYGNRRPYDAALDRPVDSPAPVDGEHFFSIVWDYGEHNLERPTPLPESGRQWAHRPDAFSSYRTGFEIRTNRLCRRILVFHQFEELGAEPCLVRSVDFQYAPSSINQSGQTEVTYLQSITQTGYVRKADGSYSRKSLPPLEFSYQHLNWNAEIKVVDSESIVHAPVGLTNNYQWVDLYGEGVSGILTEQAEGWYYKSNLGDPDEDGNVRFSSAQRVIPKPSFTGLSSAVLSIQDLEANGKKQVVVNCLGLQGFFELAADKGWRPFRSFSAVANIDLQDPNTRLIDLNGDGQPELVVTEDHAFVWYAANGKQGYAEAEWASKTFDEERGPAIVFADSQQTIFLADMTGDGLTDIVRIRNGQICYWANKGYGSFSAKIATSNAPWFDHPDSFNPSYLHLADISGTGATDIIYVGEGTFKAFLNLSGNAWSDAHEIEPFPPIDPDCKISVVDLLGTGTSCIVWSSGAPREQWAPMRYIDLMGSRKPHVLTSYVNNLGKETRLEYKSSSHFYLQDKRANKPWITRLPFPVQVISKLIVEEEVTDVRFATEYRYHHGYYDHAEREFRGFGMVEQIDTEVYETWAKNSAGNQLQHSEAQYQSPVLTKTWFHTGAFFDREHLLTQFRDEYWHEELGSHGFTVTAVEPELTDARILASSSIRDPSLIDRLTADEWREALRACKGMLLRQEVFALDAPEFGATDDQIRKQLTPHTAATHNCHVQLLQPRAGNKHAVFVVTESEAITCHYERDTADPRVAHTLNVRIDDLGNVLEAASVVYPRREVEGSLPAEVQDEQRKTLITYTRNVYTNDVISPGAYRLRLAAESQTFEITNLPRPPGQALFVVEDFREVLDGGVARSRLIEHVQSLYYRDDLTGRLPLNRLESLALPFESYQLAFTSSLLGESFGDKLPADALELEDLLGDNDSDAEQSQCKFVHREDTNWWVRSGIVRYLQDGETRAETNHRFISPLSFTDPFGSMTRVSYYRDYFLFMESVEDELQNRVSVERFNFRTLAPERLRDANDNLSSVLLDELGLVKATALEGKDLDGDGLTELEVADDLRGLEEITEGELAEIRTFFETDDSEELERIGRNLLRNATSRFVYDFDRYRRSQARRATEPNVCAQTRVTPVVAAAILREEHHSQNPASRLQFQFEYTDGLGKVAMTKAQAEPGIAKSLEVRPDCSFTVTEVDTVRRLRWIGNGRTVLNNKGNPVKQYEPYFSVTPHYEDAKELVETGVTPVLYYDSLGRLIKTEFPDQTFSEVRFDAWKQATYDQNDAVRDSKWYDKRIHNLIDAELIAEGKDPAKERAAAEKAAAHHGTPSVVHLDTLGRPILSVEHNRIAGSDEFYRTRIVLDIEGNVRSVVDARGNTVMRYKYDMLGHRVYVNSADAGERWVLNNVAGKPMRTWDSRRHLFIHTYDVLQRPLKMRVQGGDGPAPLNHEFERFVYGEGLSDDKSRNLRAQVFQHYDSSGLTTNSRFDSKSNLLEVQRRLASNYQASAVDWSDSSPTDRLEGEIFTKVTEYDALNRMTRHYNWHRNNSRVAVYEPVYNERGLLQGEDLIVGAQRNNEGGYGGGTRASAISSVSYNEKGQPTQIRNGNGTTTRYKYDPLTFRLQQLRTTRPEYDPAFPSHVSQFKNDRVIQNLFFTFDPVGNITNIYDDAYEPAFFRNQLVEPQSRYTYDALYRLIEASGRENFQNLSAPGQFDDSPQQVDFPITDQALRNYAQRYQYDSVGNIERMRHVADRGSWTRDYEYARESNRLLRTWMGGDETTAVPHNHDAHGNMLNLDRTPEEYRLSWNYRDMIHTINLGGGGRAYYNYDAGKQRTLKRIDRDGGIVEERLYLGGMEVYRRWQGATLLEEIETHHLFAGEQRMLLVEDVLRTDNANLNPGILYRYQYSNHLGSVGLELNGDARVISYEEFHPYGTTAYRANNPSIKSTAKRYRYTGMERDEESGLSYHSARYYALWLARWAAADPAGLAGGANAYAYGHKNPTVHNDPSGMQPDAVYALGMSGTPYIQLAEENTGLPPITMTGIRRTTAPTGVTTFGWPYMGAGNRIGSGYHPVASGQMAQLALQGGVAATELTFSGGRTVRLDYRIRAVHIDLRDVNIVDPSRAHLGEGHTAAEGYAIASRLAVADTDPLPVDVHVVHEGGTSVVRAGTTRVEGDSLPADWDPVLPESMRRPRPPSGGPPGGGDPPGGGGPPAAGTGGRLSFIRGGLSRAASIARGRLTQATASAIAAGAGVRAGAGAAARVVLRVAVSTAVRAVVGAEAAEVGEIVVSVVGAAVRQVGVRAAAAAVGAELAVTGAVALAGAAGYGAGYLLNRYVIEPRWGSRTGMVNDPAYVSGTTGQSASARAGLWLANHLPAFMQ